MLDRLGTLLMYLMAGLLIISVFAFYVMIEIEKYKEANHAECMPEGMPEAR